MVGIIITSKRMTARKAKRDLIDDHVDTFRWRNPSRKDDNDSEGEAQFYDKLMV